VADEVSHSGWQALSVPLHAVGLRPASYPRSDQEEAFLRLAVTHALTMAGDAIVTVSLAGSLFFSADPKAARGHVALSLLFTMLPFAVVAPFLGPAIDRSKGGRRLMLIGAAAGRSVTAFYMAGVVHSLLIYPAALVLLILSKAHAVAKSALVPATVHSPDELVRANGRLAMLAAVSGLVAAFPAAGVLKLLGAPWVLRLAAMVYLVGAVMAIRCRPAPPAEPAPWDGIDETLRSRGVVLASWAMATLRAVVGFLTFAVAFEFRRSGAPSWWYGIVLGGSLAGGFAGNVIGPRLRTRVREEHILLGCLWAVTAAGLLAGNRNSRFGLTMLAITVGLAAGVGRLAFDAIVQRDGAEGARGRSFARFEAAFQLVWVFGALLPVIIPIPNRLACFMLSVGTGVAGLTYLSGRRAALHAAHLAHDGGAAVSASSDASSATSPPHAPPPPSPPPPTGGAPSSFPPSPQPHPSPFPSSCPDEPSGVPSPVRESTGPPSFADEPVDQGVWEAVRPWPGFGAPRSEADADAAPAGTSTASGTGQVPDPADPHGPTPTPGNGQSGGPPPRPRRNPGRSRPPA